MSEIFSFRYVLFYKLIDNTQDVVQLQIYDNLLDFRCLFGLWSK